LAKPEQVEEKIAYWREHVNAKEIIPISALQKHNTGLIFDKILENLPVHPPYYPKDELTDRSERFFASEIIREKIFLTYKQEIPYSCEVIVTSFKEQEDLIRISAEILVERPNQKSIVIGKGGENLKKVGIAARKDLEEFFQKQIFLEQHVRVVPDWRNQRNKLLSLGYIME
jgi:GTPase